MNNLQKALLPLGGIQVFVLALSLVTQQFGQTHLTLPLKSAVRETTIPFLLQEEKQAVVPFRARMREQRVLLHLEFVGVQQGREGTMFLMAVQPPGGKFARCALRLEQMTVIKKLKPGEPIDVEGLYLCSQKWGIELGDSEIERGL